MRQVRFTDRPAPTPAHARAALSPQLRAVLDALPLTPGMRHARAGNRLRPRRPCPRDGRVPGLDRSVAAIAQARAASPEAIAAGRHPRQTPRALSSLAAVLTPRGRLFIDGGDPLCELTLPDRDKDDLP